MNERDVYATHLPVLARVIEDQQPKRVLEYGSGRYSTPFFLSQPIERLVTVEPDPRWRENLAAHACPRLTVLESGRPNAAKFDLIFIDDGANAEERAETIRHVLSRPHPTVVIHDAEIPEYAAAIKELAVDYFVEATNPDTAVVLK